MLRWSLRPAFLVLLLVVAASCSGAGGCSGCAGCGLTALPAGFPQGSVVPNAASVRVTRPGLDVLSANLGAVAAKLLGANGGITTFAVPDATTSFGVLFFTINVEICKPAVGPGQCVADIDVGHANLRIDAVTPHAIRIRGTVPVKADDIPVDTSLGSFDLRLGNGGCGGVTYADVPITATLPLVAETLSPRKGYTKIDTDHAVIEPTVDSSIVQTCGSLLGGVIDAFKGFVVGQVTGPLANALKSQLQSQLCTSPDPMASPTCPAGTQPDGTNTKCVFTADPSTCVPTLLGIDGHMDLGALLSKLSPGTSGAVDLVLAAGGDGDPAPDCQPNQAWSPSAGCQDVPNETDGHTPNGLTLAMVGGMLPNPQTPCVPIAPNQIPLGIPVPDELTRDGAQPWPPGDDGPHVGMALAGRFLTYAATSAYNSGVLCLGLSTEQFPALSTGYLSAVIPSLKDLTFEPGKWARPAPVAIATRPQKPPRIAIGQGTDVNKDPLLEVLLPAFATDFYVWSYDRYVRAFTFTADLTIPIDLQTGKDPKTNPNGGILPVLGALSAANGVVTNADLLWEDPRHVADALAPLLGGIVGQLLGSGLSPIDLSGALSSYGLNLSIPSDGFRKLTKGTDDYVALFADLTTGTSMFAPQVDTRVAILHQEVHPEAMTLATADASKFPRLEVALSSPGDDGTRTLEYTFWIDDQPHSAWSTARVVQVDSQYLFLQGKHVLYASARIVGHPDSEDETPAAAPFVIDVLAPYVWLDDTEGGVTIGAYDFVSEPSALQARYLRTDSRGVAGDWSGWMPLGSVGTIDPLGASSLRVQVRDESGNVGEQVELVRGRPDPTLQAAASACGCSTPGAAPRSPGVLASLILLAVFGLALRRRRTAGAIVGTLGVVAASTQGCSCGGSDAHDTGALAKTGCGSDCNQPCGPANLPGLIGSYTSVAVASDGTTWVAGYDDADVTNALLYGDLVVGKYDSGKKEVQWTTADGLPPARTDGSCPPNAANTWRHGETDPGPDVGLWTSLQVDATGHPMVAYYDATHAGLKFASSEDGGATWQSHTVWQALQSDAGRYAKMLVSDGKPVVAFLVVEPGSGGWARSRVVLATSKVALPRAAADWLLQDVAVDEKTPCRARFCGAGEVCVQSTLTCQPTATGCMPADCGASASGIGSTPQACVTLQGMATCQAVLDDARVDSYPDTMGDYVSMASGPNGIGIVVYDRTRGNLVGISSRIGAWTAQILDGQTGPNASPSRIDTGDVGVGASLAIAANGDWHVSYVNGWTESLQYLLVPAGDLTRPSPPEIVDDGRMLDGSPNADGPHIVGDDSSLTIDAVGTVRIVYQDATAGALREATGTPSAGSTHSWSLKAIAQPGRFAGFFPHYVAQMPAIANWYRLTDHSQTPPIVRGDVAFVSP
jgi:MYXO-CTERM domain-containing protein